MKITADIKGVSYGGLANLKLESSANDAVSIGVDEYDSRGSKTSTGCRIALSDVPLLIRLLTAFVVPETKQ